MTTSLIAATILCLANVGTRALLAQDLPTTPVEIADTPKWIDPTELINGKLSAKVSKSFDEISLSEVAQWLQEQSGLSVILDERSLGDAGILPSEPITDSMSESPIYLLLDRLKRRGIGWRVSQGILFLQSDRESEVYAVQYNVGDLLDKNYKPDRLIHTIHRTIDAPSWSESGGTGDATLLGDILFVRQVASTHRKISGLLAALRSPARRILIDEPSQHEPIREALTKNLSVQYKGESLSSAIQKLAATTKLDMRLDRIALSEGKVSERIPVTLELLEQPLETVLDILTSQLRLSWFLRDGVLWISTRDAPRDNRKLALFDVRDLCRNLQECESLKSAIEQQANPGEWEPLGGIGIIEFPTSGIMIVSQTERQLDGVLRLLETYRFALKNSKRRITPEQDPEGLQTTYYRMPSQVAEDLETQLPILVAPETWRSGEHPNAVGTIVKVRSWDEIVHRPDARESKESRQGTEPFSVLIIQQKRRVHAEIAEVLHKVQHGEASKALQQGGGMGGMGGGFGGGMF